MDSLGLLLASCKSLLLGIRGCSLFAVPGAAAGAQPVTGRAGSHGYLLFAVARCPDFPWHKWWRDATDLGVTPTCCSRLLAVCAYRGPSGWRGCGETRSHGYLLFVVACCSQLPGPSWSQDYLLVMVACCLSRLAPARREVEERKEE